MDNNQYGEQKEEMGGQYTQNAQNMMNAQGYNNYNQGQQGGFQVPLEEPVSMGEWLISMLILLIPCVHVVMLFVWAFSSNEKKSKSNFFKAYLIVTAIGLALSIIIVVISVVTMGSFMGELSNMY